MQKRVIQVAIIVCGFLFLFLSGYAVGRIVKTKEVQLEKVASEKQNIGLYPTKEKTTPVAKNRLNPEIVSLLISETRDQNFNFKVGTKNFYFTPENFGGTISQNTGIVEVLINNKPFTNSYDQNFSIPHNMLTTGTNTVEVVLVANDGSYRLNNKNNSPISTSTDIFIK